MRTRTFPARISLRADPVDEPNPDGIDDPAPDPEPAAKVEPGQFEALVSVFGNKDSYGEVVMPGAFTRTLAEWEAKGDPIPVYWSHRLDDPDFNIGHVLEAKEIDEGLWVKAQLDLENPKAVTTHNLMKQRRVTDFSFSFNVPPGGMTEGDDGIELNDIELYEVGPTPIGANPATDLIGVKSGRVLSEKNIAVIKDARAAMATADKALGALLKAATSDGDDGKSAGERKVKDEGSTGVKSEELPVDPDSALAYIRLITL